MRYGTDHKAKTRERVLQAAGEALRAKGAEGFGVAAVMAQAGLTHGAFYAHFPSKDALVAEAAADAGRLMRERFAVRVAGLGPAAAFRAQVDHYLSATHRDATAAGCLLPSMSSDAARGGDSLREAYAQVVATFVEIMQSLLDGLNLKEPGLARSMVAELVGALALARAIDDDTVSTEILESSRAALLRRAGVA